jgi:hypothetical protein
MAEAGWARHVADILRRNDIGLFATVPREEEGVGLLAGAWLDQAAVHR